MTIQNLTGFEGFEGATSRIGGFTPSAEYGRGGGKGIGHNGPGLHVGTGWNLNAGGLITLNASIGFAFKNFSDADWGGSVTLLSMYSTWTGAVKCSLGITAQKQLVLSTYDRTEGVPLVRAYSTASLKDDAWHYLELLWSSGGGDTCIIPAGGTASVYINGKLAASFSGSTDVCVEDSPDPFNPTMGVNRFNIGILSGFLNETRHMAFDDIYAAAAGNVIGDIAALEMQLEADVSVELTPVPGPDNVDMVTDDPPDDATTYNMSDDVDYKFDSFSIVDLDDPTGTVQAVQLDFRAQKTSTALWRVQPWVFVNGEEWRQYHLGQFPAFEAWATSLPAAFWEAPGPPDESGYVIGTEWTWEKIQDLEVGYVICSPGATVGGLLPELTPVVFYQF